ncbi:MAG: hypothetical protein KDB00_25430 [Planctomycetales bacterium]|nr:hypothetical protein [Planctomycetales bacterium]
MTLCILTIIDDVTDNVIVTLSTTDPVLRVLAAIAICFTLGMVPTRVRAQFSNPGDSDAFIERLIIRPSLYPCQGDCPDTTADHDTNSVCPDLCVTNSQQPDGGLDWLDEVKVGYDHGIVIASKRELELNAARYPYLMRINGWGQLRHTRTNFETSDEDLNQLQLKRGRLVFSGTAHNPNLTYFVQLDGRSSTGDGVRLLDYYVGYDFGNDQFGLEPGTIVFRTGKYKVPFTMSRWLSGRDFEFSDRSMSSIFFDVNRSYAVGLYGQTKRLGTPIHWETALFNGLVTGGAETGSSGALDNNFAYSGRLYGYPTGDWGSANLPDLEWHTRLATRVGCGFASSVIQRSGLIEFNRLRVADSGATLANVLPNTVSSYATSLYAIDASLKYRGWSSTFEYYFRNISDVRGASVPDLFDHGFWFQLGKFIVPGRLELVARWSRVQGDSGTLGTSDQSSEEIAGAVAWYLRKNQIKMVADITHLDGAPINATALDIAPGDRGWLFRSQMQFAF